DRDSLVRKQSSHVPRSDPAAPRRLDRGVFDGRRAARARPVSTPARSPVVRPDPALLPAPHWLALSPTRPGRAGVLVAVQNLDPVLPDSTRRAALPASPRPIAELPWVSQSEPQSG